MDATFKHHLAFFIRTDDLRGSTYEAPRVVAADIWREGILLFIFSAPRSCGCIWWVRLAVGSCIIGEALLL